MKTFATAEQFYFGRTADQVPLSDVAALVNRLGLLPTELGAWLGIDTTGVTRCETCNSYEARGHDCESKARRESARLWLAANREIYECRQKRLAAWKRAWARHQYWKFRAERARRERALAERTAAERESREIRDRGTAYSRRIRSKAF